jgi:polyisoprenoid-binding protein YceI
MSRIKLVIAAVVVLAVLAVGGPFVYIHFIEGDAKPALSLGPTVTTAKGATGSASSTDVAGTWKAGAGSEAGYRVKEVLLGQDATAVGRTQKVTGAMTIEGITVSSAKVTVDMASVSSEKSLRDSQFRGRIMDVSSFPTASFELADPIALASLPADDAQITAKATGTLTLHGVAKKVTFDLNAVRSGGTIKVQGSIPIHFADYGVDNPSGGPAKVGDDGELEFLVAFTKG